MADFTVTCPHCKQSLDCPEEYTGKCVQCPACNGTISISSAPASIPLRQAAVPTMAPAPAQGTINVEIQRGSSPLGIAALVMGILTSLICWIPFLGVLSIPVAVIGLILAAIGLIMAVVSKKTGIVFPISGGIACALSIAIALAVTGSCAKVVSDAMEKNDKTNQATTQANQVGYPFANGGEKSPSTQNNEQEWAQANLTLSQGLISVKVKECAIGQVRLKDMFGDEGVSKNSHLCVSISVQNISQTKKMDFTTWRGRDFSIGRDKATITDNNGNKYELITFSRSGKPVNALDNVSLYPGQTVTDLVIFEKPVDGIKWLHLELPASNFGGSGMLRIEIPAAMIEN